MLTVEGVYADGKVELAQRPAQIDRARVLVTFLDSTGVDLRACGTDEAHAADLRARLNCFAEDWDRPEAAVYDED